jgi:hypothetical protein
VRGLLVAAGQAPKPKGCQITPALRRRVLSARPVPSGHSAHDKTVRVTMSQLRGDPLLTPKRACGRVAFVYTEAHPSESAAIAAP